MQFALPSATLVRSGAVEPLMSASTSGFRACFLGSCRRSCGFGPGHAFVRRCSLDRCSGDGPPRTEVT